jgi:assimilatory nitrate reductase catalytic subunit
VNAAVRTTCPYCGVGCGLRVTRQADGQVTIEGDAEHPANLGRLCAKGLTLGATLGLEDRLLSPSVDGKPVEWSFALDQVAQAIKRCLNDHGPDSIAFYVSGQLLTEDYYVANKLMKGFIGSANIDTNSRLCMSSAVAGHIRAFGEDLVPVDYRDLEQAELLVLVGSNTAWCHPVIMQRIRAARAARPALKLVVIDPRRTPTCEEADLHLPLRAGTDVALFNGLLVWLTEHGYADHKYIDEHTEGCAAALAAARSSSSDIAATAQACGLAAAGVEEFFQIFGRSPRAITLFSQGVNQSSAGTDKVNSIINCHLLTGRIGRPGAGPFSITGQPNAMGGREVGGLANQLAAHLRLENHAERSAVQAFWQSPVIASKAGLKAVELFEAVADGRIQLLWIIATNPVVSLPDSAHIQAALRRCPMVIVSDCVADTDTLKFARIKLPASAWGEKDGTVTNSDRTISCQRSFLNRPESTRPDWWILCQVAQRLGHAKHFAYQAVHEIFDEHVQLTQVARQFGRQLNLDHWAGLSAAAYAKLSPTQWPRRRQDRSHTRLFADGKFSTPSGKAQLIATPLRLPRHERSLDYPVILNTGRQRDQWHTMTRTARAPSLAAEDLERQRLVAGSLVQVISRQGRCIARLRSSGELSAGSAFMSIHWSDSFASDSRVANLIDSVVDPISGEPEFKHTPVRIEPLQARWQGFLLSREQPRTRPADWSAGTRTAFGWRTELTGFHASLPDAQWLRDRIPATEAFKSQWLEYEDVDAGSYRAACFIDGLLHTVLIAEQQTPLPSRSWLQAQFASNELSPELRRSILTGRPSQADEDPGVTVCACHSVGTTAIAKALAAGADSITKLGDCTRAGTQCGSCKPELQRMLQKHLLS